MKTVRRYSFLSRGKLRRLAHYKKPLSLIILLDILMRKIACCLGLVALLAACKKDKPAAVLPLTTYPITVYATTGAVSQKLVVMTADSVLTDSAVVNSFNRDNRFFNLIDTFIVGHHYLTYQTVDTVIFNGDNTTKFLAAPISFGNRLSFGLAAPPFDTTTLQGALNYHTSQILRQYPYGVTDSLGNTVFMDVRTVGTILQTVTVPMLAYHRNVAGGDTAAEVYSLQYSDIESFPSIVLGPRDTLAYEVFTVTYVEKGN